MVLIKNGSGLLGLGTLKSAVFQEWIDQLGWYFACWYKFMEAKSYLKGYLHYKTITSQNVPSKAQIKNFFIS